MTRPVLEQLTANLPAPLRARAQRDIPLAQHTTYRVGGPAALWLEACADDEVAQVRGHCLALGVPLAVLGNGSNVIAPDQGFDGLVLKLGSPFAAIRRLDEDRCYVEAGALLSQAAEAALSWQRSGLEWMVDIPGSLGGAVLMNAGNNEGEMRVIVDSVRFLDERGEQRELPVDELAMGYRASRFKDSQDILLGATLKLGAIDAVDAIATRMRQQRETRGRKFPMEYPNAGSVFKRPSGFYAGKLIEDCGLKGLRVGGAQVSPKHAGFIVNSADASAADLLALVRQVQQRVHARFGVELEMEQVVLGARIPGASRSSTGPDRS